MDQNYRDREASAWRVSNSERYVFAAACRRAGVDDTNVEAAMAAISEAEAVRGIGDVLD